MPLYRQASDTPLYSQASWIPDPRPWTPRKIQSGFILHNPKRPLPLPTVLQDAGPKVSSDGTTLFKSATKFGEIEQYFSLPKPFTKETDGSLVLGLNWIAQVVPRVYLSIGQLDLEVLVNVVVSRYRLQREPVAQSFEATLLVYYCIILATSGEDNAKELADVYLGLRRRHPDAPWPVNLNVRDSMSFTTIDSGDLVEHYFDDLAMHSGFITKRGYLESGPIGFEMAIPSSC
jgi:hypothetical protein